MNYQYLTTLGIVALCGVLLVIGLWLNRGYGTVSTEAYEYSKSLYGACLNKNDSHLNRVDEMLSVSESLPAHERNWLVSIIEDAREGNWESASKEARQIMEDQVEY